MQIIIEGRVFILEKVVGFLDIFLEVGSNWLCQLVIGFKLGFGDILVFRMDFIELNL